MACSRPTTHDKGAERPPVGIRSGHLDGDLYHDSSSSKILDGLLHTSFALSILVAVVYNIPLVLQRK